MESITKISTKNMSGTEWRQARKASIGGSDAAAILRLSDYSSPYTVWAEKTGRIPEKEDNEAMRQGRDLEQYVADRFCEQTGKKVRRVNAIIKNDRTRSRMRTLTEPSSENMLDSNARQQVS